MIPPKLTVTPWKGLGFTEIPHQVHNGCCRVLLYWQDPMPINTDQFQSKLRHWSQCHSIPTIVDHLGSMPKFWSASGIDRGSNVLTINDLDSRSHFTHTWETVCFHQVHFRPIPTFNAAKLIPIQYEYNKTVKKGMQHVHEPYVHTIVPVLILYTFIGFLVQMLHDKVLFVRI